MFLLLSQIYEAVKEERQEIIPHIKNSGLNTIALCIFKIGCISHH